MRLMGDALRPSCRFNSYRADHIEDELFKFTDVVKEKKKVRECLVSVSEVCLGKWLTVKAMRVCPPCKGVLALRETSLGYDSKGKSKSRLKRESGSE